MPGPTVTCPAASKKWWLMTTQYAPNRTVCTHPGPACEFPENVSEFEIHVPRPASNRATRSTRSKCPMRTPASSTAAGASR